MTREQLCELLVRIGNAYKTPGVSCQNDINWVLNEYAEQRAEIERLTKEKDKWAELAGSFTKSQHQYLRDTEALKIEIEALKAQMAKSFDRKRFENEPPCYLCGYSGQNYFQPDTHPCAKFYHEKEHP